MPTRKALMKLGAARENPAGTYVASTDLLPFTTQDANQEWEPIPDNSIIGVAFKDVPLQGGRAVRGPLEVQADLATMAVLLRAAFGYVSTGVYSLPIDKNEEALSFCRLDGVKTNKYAGCFLNNFNFKSTAKEDAKITCDILGYKAELRDDTAFPTTSVAPGTRILHQQAQTAANGYVRLGDQDNALANTDDLQVKEIGFGINWNFDLDYYNSQESLIPLSGSAGVPEASLSLVINRHSTDQFKTWVDARTLLQAEIKYYATATKYFMIQVPNLVLFGAPLSNDEVPSIELKIHVGRNGTGTAYTNNNMQYVTPIRATISNI